jgi:hypothetical protein
MKLWLKDEQKGRLRLIFLNNEQVLNYRKLLGNGKMLEHQENGVEN